MYTAIMGGSRIFVRRGCALHPPPRSAPAIGLLQVNKWIREQHYKLLQLSVEYGATKVWLPGCDAVTGNRLRFQWELVCIA